MTEPKQHWKRDGTTWARKDGVTVYRQTDAKWFVLKATGGDSITFDAVFDAPDVLDKIDDLWPLL